MDHIDIDVHKKGSQICILSEDGELIERRVRTESGRFAEVLGQQPRARLLIESATDSEGVARCLEALGHEVIVADPNFAPNVRAAPPQEPPHPSADRVEHLRHLGVARRIRRVEGELPSRRPGEHAVEGPRVKVHVQVEPAAEALHGCHGPGAAR